MLSRSVVAIPVISLLILCCYSCNSKGSADSAKDSSSVKLTADTNDLKVVHTTEMDGLWTGIFEKSAEDSLLDQKREKFETAYYKKIYGDDEGGDYEGITDGKLIPEELKKLYYKEPLWGYFETKAPNKITLNILGLNAAGELVGHSICAGNERIVKGTLTHGGLAAELKEPGTDKNDGIFSLAVAADKSKITGNWKPLNVSSVKAFTLDKTVFKYNTGDSESIYFRPKGKNSFSFTKNPSLDILTSKDVENLTKPELAIIRNLLYARHGFSFANAAYRNYFERMDWYFPYKSDIRNDLTDIEKKNLEKIKSYEKYAASAYDEYGR